MIEKYSRSIFLKAKRLTYYVESDKFQQAKSYLDEKTVRQFIENLDEDGLKRYVNKISSNHIELMSTQELRCQAQIRAIAYYQVKTREVLIKYIIEHDVMKYLKEHWRQNTPKTKWTSNGIKIK